jgi:hypothetical protein
VGVDAAEVSENERVGDEACSVLRHVILRENGDYEGIYGCGRDCNNVRGSHCDWLGRIKVSTLNRVIVCGKSFDQVIRNRGISNFTSLAIATVFKHNNVTSPYLDYPCVFVVVGERKLARSFAGCLDTDPKTTKEFVSVYAKWHIY